jgi:hypothetical protein
VNVIHHSDFKHKTTISLNPYYFTTKVIPKGNQSVSEKGMNANINNKEKAKQYRQCTYNATLRRVHATILAVEKQ